jgi:DNA gyrase subunit A
VEEVEYNEEAFIADEDCQVVVTRDGWVKRVRELKDPTSTRMREGDELMALVSGSLKSSLIFFSSAGAAYTTRFNDVPASTGYGDPVQKLFKFDDNERVVGALSLDPRLPFPAMMIGVSKDGYGMRFDPTPLKEISTRSGRRFAKAGQGDEIVGVSGCTEKDLLGVVTKKTNALVCKVDEVNVLAGPGRGVTVIKTADDDQVMAFLCTTAKSDKELTFETAKGKTLKFSLGKYEVTGRGGKGREMSKKDEIKTVNRALDLVLLPEAPKTDKPEKKEK